MAQWQDSAEAILGDTVYSFGGQKLVVCNSALPEDSFTSANAGAYDSVLNVDVADPTAASSLRGLMPPLLEIEQFLDFQLSGY